MLTSSHTASKGSGRVRQVRGARGFGVRRYLRWPGVGGGVIASRAVSSLVGPQAAAQEAYCKKEKRHTGAEFLSDSRHRIVFHYAPRHRSWMNQVIHYTGDPLQGHGLLDLVNLSGKVQ